MEVVDEIRVFSLDEAEETLEVIRPILEEAQQQAVSVRECDAQLRDMLQIHGEKKVHDPDSDVYREFRNWAQKRKGHLLILQEAVETVHGHGVEVKDPETGLVDFYSEIGEDVVYLCWKLDEERIRYWHTLEGGFAGRQPIPGVGLLEP